MHKPQIETFICVAETGSFNKAAEALFISPTAIIKQVNLLEREIGVPLFVRTHRGMFLTEGGESLYRDAKYMVQYSKESVVRARNAMRKEENVIYIGTSQITPPKAIHEFWPEIKKKCPDIIFRMVPFENRSEVAKNIIRTLGEEIDIVQIIFDDTAFAGKYNALKISQLPICCAVSLNHPLAVKERLCIQDLYGENLMLRPKGWNYYVDLLRDDLLRNHPQIEIIDFDFYDMDIFNECEVNKDILMTVETWKTVHPLVRILPVDWEYTIPYGLLYSLHPKDHVRRFISCLEDILEKHKIEL